MSIRTGILRIATVIRGAGWIVAIGAVAIGIGSGIESAWQYPWEDAPLSKHGARCTDRVGKPIACPSGPFTFEEAQPSSGPSAEPIPRKKEFQFAEIRWLHMAAGLAAGIALLGTAYVCAWVLAGFAPGN